MRFVVYIICLILSIFLSFYLSVRGADISAQVPPIGVKFCVMDITCPGSVFSPFGGGVPRGFPNPKFWA